MEDTAAPLVTRNDQLTKKATTKDARKQKVAKNKKRAKQGKGKSGGKRNTNNKKRSKTAASSSMPKSPSKRKRSILQHSKRQGMEETKLEDEQEHGGKEAQTSKKPRSSGSKPSGRASKSKAVPPPKHEVKAKAKATAKGKAKAKAAAKIKKEDAQEKPKGAGKGRRSKQKIPHEEHALYRPGIVSTLTEFARSVSDFSRDVKSSKFKSFVRSHLSELSLTALNIYWTRSNCGVTDKKTGADIHNFSFNASSACASHRLACAVKCADIAATCMTCAGKFVYLIFLKGPPNIV